jgi:hypothetical protein
MERKSHEVAHDALAEAGALYENYIALADLAAIPGSVQESEILYEYTWNNPLGLKIQS